MKESISNTAIAVVVSASAALLFAQAPPAAPPRPPARPNFLISRPTPDPAAVERGEKLFVASCGFCHGSKANGGEGGPDLVRSVIALRDEGGDEIGPVILHGRPDKGMPPLPMTEAQIKDIAAFLRFRQQSAINRGAYPIQNVVTGNPVKGHAYFDAHCGACHSPTGDLKGVATKYDPVALQSRFLYPETRGSRRSRAVGKGVPVTVALPSGEKFSGSLDYIDDFNVALRDSEGAYRSFDRVGGVKVDVHDPLAAHQQLLKQYSDADIHNLTAYLETLK